MTIMKLVCRYANLHNVPKSISHTPISLYSSQYFWLVDQLSRKAMLPQDLKIFRYTTSCVVSIAVYNRYLLNWCKSVLYICIYYSCSVNDNAVTWYCCA